MIRAWPVFLAVILLIGCQHPVRLMPAPVVFAAGEHSLFSANRSLETSNQVQVFYATNRMPLGPRGARLFTSFPGERLYLGLATVRIGPEGKPWESLFSLSTTSCTTARPVLRLESLDEIAAIGSGEAEELASPEARNFFALINEALAQSIDKDLTIYVHGVNTNVERAAAQAAQYRHFTGRNSVVLVFAWPSTGSILRYLTDVGNARLSGPVFARLIELLARHTTAEHLNLLVFSAGAQVASAGLAHLSGLSRGDSGDRSLRLGEVYFAAPDLAFPTFVEQLSRYIDLARRITVAVNLNDSALRLSRLIHGISRLGRPDLSELSEEESRLLIEASARLDFDAISVESNVIPGLRRRSHSFWYDHPWVSSDVLIKFLFHVPPSIRGLDQNRGERGFQYWTFPPDYDTRVVEIMRRLRSDRFGPAPGAAMGDATLPEPQASF
jgi:esterase/lipase superfamily enzyme